MTFKDYLFVLIVVVSCVLFITGVIISAKQDAEFAERCTELGGVPVKSRSNIVCINAQKIKVN